MSLSKDIAQNLTSTLNSLVHFVTLDDVRVYPLVSSASATVVYKGQALATMSCAWYRNGELAIGLNDMAGHNILDYTCHHDLDAETFFNVTPSDFYSLIEGRPWEMVRSAVLAHVSVTVLHRISCEADADGILVQ